MEKEYDSCRLCPQNCGTNRNAGGTGLCGETSEVRVSWAGLHFGEEPPVTGKGGSGAVFITGCNLRCQFCQNWQISRQGMGRTVTVEEFSLICISLQNAGAENINIVTGSHAIPGIASGLRQAVKDGLVIPVLWNSSAYEKPASLALLDGLVSVWLPDLKTLNPLLSKSIFGVSDYPATAKSAIRFMAASSPLRVATPEDKDYPSGKIFSGVIMRHLALPGKIADTELVLRWFAKHLGDKAILSLMTQYTPIPLSPYSSKLDAFPDRPLARMEYDEIHRLLEELEIETGFYQELAAGSDWLPDFKNIQPFSSKLASPVWHFSCGFFHSIQ